MRGICTGKSSSKCEKWGEAAQMGLAEMNTCIWEPGLCYRIKLCG